LALVPSWRWEGWLLAGEHRSPGHDNSRGWRAWSLEEGDATAGRCLAALLCAYVWSQWPARAVGHEVVKEEEE
jgi:hypothetical protein